MMKKTFLTITLFILLSCNENIPIEPKYKKSRDWNTEIKLTHNNYNRIRLEIDSLPPVNIQRDILFLYLEAKNQEDNEFSVIDSFENQRGYYLDYFLSKPLFEKETEYEIRIRWDFIEGDDKVSNSIVFTANNFGGKILQEVDFFECESCIDYLEKFYFYNNELYILGCSKELAKYNFDTEETIIINPEENYYYNEDFLDFGDVIVTRSQYNTESIGYHYFNPSTGSYDISGFVNYGDFDTQLNIGDIFSHDSSLFVYRYYRWQDSAQIVQVNPFTREIEREYDKFYHFDEFGWYSLDFTSDGENIWVSFDRDTIDNFENKIVKFDLETNKKILPEYDIPIYYAMGLKWDGSHFWTTSYQEHKFMKFKLED